MRLYLVTVFVGVAANVLGAQAKIVGDYVLATANPASRAVRAAMSLGTDEKFRLVTNVDTRGTHYQGSYSVRGDSVFLTEEGGGRIRGQRVGRNIVIAIADTSGEMELTLRPLESPADADARGPVTPKDSAMYVTVMRSDLNNLVAAQSYYRAARSKYTSSMEELGYRVSNGVNSPQIVATDTSWSATISHSRLPGARCAVAVATPNPLGTSVSDGKVYCR